MNSVKRPKQMIPYPFRHFAHWFGTRYGVILTGSVPDFSKGLKIGKVEITPENAEALLQLLDGDKPSRKGRSKKEAVVEEPIVKNKKEDKDE